MYNLLCIIYYNRNVTFIITKKNTFLILHHLWTVLALSIVSMYIGYIYTVCHCYYNI